MPGGHVVIRKATGLQMAVSGIVGLGELTSRAEALEKDEAPRVLWRGEDWSGRAFQVRGVIQYRCLTSKEEVCKDWLKKNPISLDRRILKLM